MNLQLLFESVLFGIFVTNSLNMLGLKDISEDNSSQEGVGGFRKIDNIKGCPKLMIVYQL